eukprot:scaffold5537_cov54-Cyclotella_meneghiniana.AAC.7
MNSNRATDASVLPSSAGNIAIAAILASLGYIVYSRKCDKKKKYPPFAPGSMLQHIQACTSAEYPWFLLHAARQLNTRIFRLKVKTGNESGPTLNTTNGAEWHAKRKAVAPAFSPNQVKRMTNDYSGIGEN